MSMRTRQAECTDLEGHEANDDAEREEDEGLDKPDDTPDCGSSTGVNERWGLDAETEGKREKEEKGVPREGQHPQILANAEASEVLTLRDIVSSAGWLARVQEGFADSRLRTDDIPENVHARHDPDEQDLIRVMSALYGVQHEAHIPGIVMQCHRR